MPYYTDRYEKHQVHEWLDKLEQALEAALKRQTEVVEFEHVERIGNALRFLRDRMTRLDPQLNSPGSLDSMSRTLNNAVAELASFAAGSGLTHLENATNHLDSTLIHAQGLAVLYSSEDVDGVRESVVHYRRSLGQLARNAKGELKELRQEVQSLRDIVDVTEPQVDTALEKLEDRLRVLGDEWDEIKIKRSSEFADEIAGAKATTADMVGYIKKTNQEALEEGERHFARNIELLQERGSEAFSEIERMRDETAQLVGVIARTGMAGGYQEIADKQEQKALQFRAGAVTALIALAIVTIIALFVDGDLVSLWKKTPLMLAFLLLSGYLAREAEMYRRGGQVNRQKQLDLSSIGPFLEDLPKDEQRRAKLLLADRMFGKYEGIRGKADVPDPSPNVRNSLKQLLPTKGEGD